MFSLQQKMKTEKNKEKNAAATWQYAIALARSVIEEESWALTTYYIGSYNDYDNTWEKPLRKRSNKLIRQAGKTMKISKNIISKTENEWQEKVDAYLSEWGFNEMAINENKGYRAFLEQYKNNYELQYFMSGGCDNFKSYYTSYIFDDIVRSIPLSQYIDYKWSYKQ
jgi:hypothetical protein